MHNVNQYKIIYYYSFEDMCYLATIPELGGCISDGETPERAIANARELCRDWLDIACGEGWEIPQPTTLAFPEGGELRLMDVAAYILTQTGNITAKALQKLSYYCKAWSCGWFKRPIFPEQFQAWSGGPVNYELFKRHQGLLTVGRPFFDAFDINEPSGEQKQFIDKILGVYGEIRPDELGRMSHKEAPWIKARKGLPDDAPSSEFIKESDLMDFYGKAY